MPSAARPSTKAAQREQSMRRLVAESRRRFAADGYAHVRVDEVAASAGMTKGAVYHHFDSKDGLFRAVAADVHREVAEAVDAATEGLGTWDQLVVGSATFLRASAAPAVRRIMLVDAPAVLGWDGWRALDDAASMPLLEDVLARLIEEGELAPQPVEPLARLLSGAMNEAALWVAASEQPDRDLDAAVAALERLLAALRAQRVSDDRAP